MAISRAREIVADEAEAGNPLARWPMHCEAGGVAPCGADGAARPRDGRPVHPEPDCERRHRQAIQLASTHAESHCVPGRHGLSAHAGNGVTAHGKRIIAYVCLVLGITGFALPLLPGIPFLLVGFKLLGPHHPIVRPAARLLRRWFKRI